MIFHELSELMNVLTIVLLFSCVISVVNFSPSSNTFVRLPSNKKSCAIRQVLLASDMRATRLRTKILMSKENRAGDTDCIECIANSTTSVGIQMSENTSVAPNHDPMSLPQVTIDYCTGCKWLLRASWTATELLTTFEKDISGVNVRPGRSTGVFNVWVENELVWNRTASKRFPELKELKQMVRDIACPDRGLGHSDK
jgi:selenoprotein W-related protein